MVYFLSFGRASGAGFKEPLPQLIEQLELIPDKSGGTELTHLPLAKMAATIADNILKCIFFNDNGKIPIKLSLKLAPKSPIDNKPALVWVMAWHRTGNKPLPEPMMMQFTDVFMQH